MAASDSYVVAVAATAVALYARWLLNPLLDHRLPFITMYGGVAVSVWFGGWRPGLLAVGLGYVGGDLLFIETEPHSPLSLQSPGGLAGLAAYVASSLILIGFGNGMRAAQQRAEASARNALARQKRLEEEVAERRHAEEALAESDRRKDEFLAMLAHELRNPLAPIGNALQVMRLAPAGGEATAQARAIIDRQFEQLVRIVDDLLDLSRVTSGKIELRKGRIELGAAVQSALETSRPVIEASGHDLTLTLPSEPIYLDADLNRLTQVFCNLLNNACKFTPRGGRIWLCGEQNGGEVVVRVGDNGAGIPADVLPRVFDMFAQADRSLERSQGGLGIGLTLVRRLVELHGGRVEARSDGPGKGSEFTVHLPLALALAPAPAPDAPSPLPESRGAGVPSRPPERTR